MVERKGCGYGVWNPISVLDLYILPKLTSASDLDGVRG